MYIQRSLKSIIHSREEMREIWNYFFYIYISIETQ